jgi:hypothetical protein
MEWSARAQRALSASPRLDDDDFDDAPPGRGRKRSSVFGAATYPPLPHPPEDGSREGSDDGEGSDEDEEALVAPPFGGVISLPPIGSTPPPPGRALKRSGTMSISLRFPGIFEKSGVPDGAIKRSDSSLGGAVSAAPSRAYSDASRGGGHKVSAEAVQPRGYAGLVFLKEGLPTERTKTLGWRKY